MCTWFQTPNQNNDSRELMSFGVEVELECITDDTGAPKYTQLVPLVKCVVSLSHGDSIPERRFSINKLMLDCTRILNL